MKLKKLSTEERKKLKISAIFLWFTLFGLAIGRAAIETNFIGTIGASEVPKVYIINAILVALFSFFYSSAEKKVDRFLYLFWIILCFFLLLFLIRSQFSKGYIWLPYIAFAYYDIVYIILQVHFWTCMNDIYDPIKAKRIFPILGAIGLSGGIAGGLLTWILSPYIGYENLFYIWIGILFIKLPISLSLYLQNKDSSKELQEIEEKQSFKEIWSFSLVRYLTYISIPLWIVIHSLDWLFYLSIEDIYKNEPNKLSSFLGLINGLTSTVAILFQIYLSQPLLRKLGTPLSYSLYSISMGLASLLFVIKFYMLTGAGIWIKKVQSILTISTRFLDESIQYSIYDTAFQLLFGALPKNVRGQARAFYLWVQ